MNSSSSQDHPPSLTELELTVFGPGTGECIVLHLGNNDWMVIDSCCPPSSDEPAALDYFGRIGVDPRARVRCILATHWHDDHIQGLAKIVDHCADARFAMSGALSGQEFFRIVLEVDALNKLVKDTSSASELADILESLKTRSDAGLMTGPGIYAQDGTRLFRGGYAGNVEVWALSPSSATITNAMGALAARLLTPSN